MKTKDRQRLKENDLVHSIAAAREFIEPRQKQMTTVIIAAVVVVVAIVAGLMIRQRMNNRGDRELAEAMVALNARVIPATETKEGELPEAANIGARGTFATETAKLNAAVPKLRAAADAYPDSHAGLTARYHLAGALAALGRYSDALKEFDQVAQRSGNDSLYGRMARLGKADAEARSGQLDAAITSYQTLAQQKDSELPQDAILMELARAYAAKGNAADAKKTFTQLVDQHPDSPYTAEARQELESLKG